MSTLDVAVRPEHPAPLLPMEPQKAQAMMQAYRELCESILTPDDVIGIPGQPGGFIKRSGFSKLSTFYGVSTTILDQHMERDEDGKPIHAHARVRAVAQNGRYAEGDGACAISEPRFKNPSGRVKAEHDLMATAVTRSTNRAISNLIGFGTVSAEEADDAEPARVFGDPATPAEEDGLLRALEDLGATAKAAKRVIEDAGYLPKVAARAVMYAARDVADVKREQEARQEAKEAETEKEPTE